MTGLTLDQFQTLTAHLTPLWPQAERVRFSRRARQHAIGQGRTYKLATLADTLLCVRVFYRFALTDERLDWLVRLDASTICRLPQRLEPLLEQAADSSLELSVRRRLPPGTQQIGTRIDDREEGKRDLSSLENERTPQEWGQNRALSRKGLRGLRQDNFRVGQREGLRHSR
jgi:hypothetical protein